ncbi:MULTISPECIES: plasmid partitioning protein RepB [unclassified Shinella]|uniref:plasmid partitioning protein RepB n=1 Tax=unclassified Shinella TaxID=2643062 RepID=UPI00225CB806|nr:plasmid partitioning protein RepB [Shinella sp. YE25]CAI0341349.1 Plasmid partitioning protein RepB [Rhizobiaceae bacterium]CAK7260984.1 ParB family transcriptional regulator, chromosome partitioning protein [Shinella sp. WSC3-e]
MTNAKDRSNRMKSLFANVDRAELEKHIPSPAAAVGRPSTSGSMSGAVKSMQQTFSAVELENERLRTQLQSGESGIELDPADIIPAFVRDRMDFEDSPEFAGFVDGIRREGQKLPILVRPLPDQPGRYQIAYGHRRHRACQIIGIPVRAVVAPLTDEELVVAQGIENAERANPSFIEQAMYAVDLKKRGFTRETIARALGRNEEKGLAYISMLTATASALPEALVRKIGPAPAIGRPKWEKLGSFFNDQKLPAEINSALNGLVGSEKFLSLTTDERFLAALRILDRPSRSENEKATGEIDLGHGVVVTTKRTSKAMQISIPHAPAPGLSSWLVERLPALMEEFKRSNEARNS